MKRQVFWTLLVALNYVTIEGAGQAPSVPVEVTDVFGKMFPDAKGVEWRDKIDKYIVFFKIKEVKCEAKFSRTGGWISTEEPIQKDSLPAAVLDGLRSGTYAEWPGSACYILRLPGGVAHYHVVVRKADGGRKILFFDQGGRLLTE